MNSANTVSDSPFPPVESWKAAMMQLPVGPFFDILRSYLGDIKTPYNKQRLVDELGAFLSRQEIQKRIALLLDDADRRCIAAVGLLRSGTLQDLAVFFEGDYTFADLYGTLLNLEERLIIYRILEEGQPRLFLNPVLEPVLAPILYNGAILFPAQPIAGPQPAPPISPELVLGALLAWLSGTNQAFKADGNLKKKSQEELEALFALIGGSAAVVELIQALEYLGLLHIEEGQHHIDEDRLEAFAALDTGERLEYLAAALIAVDLELDATSRRLSRERLQSWARLCHRMLHSLQDSLLYGEQSLRRLWLVEERRQEERRRFGERSPSRQELSHCPGVEPLAFFRALLQAMRKSFLITPIGDGFARTHLPDTGPEQRPFIVCDAGYSVIVYPEIPFPDLCKLVRFCRFRELGQTMKLELFQEGLVRAFDRGILLEDIRELLERLSAKPVPQNLSWSLEEWSRRYASAALYRGMVLVLAPERRYIAEIDMVASHIERELAPGVYLLRNVDEALLVEALEKAGLDTLARPKPVGLSNTTENPGQEHPMPIRSSPFTRTSGRFFGRVGNRSALWQNGAGESSVSGIGLFQEQRQVAPQTETSGESADMEAGRNLLEALHATLERKTFTKEQKEELSARIERRLILDESQLVAAAVRYEKLEARGLDYVGKVRLAEQALSQGSLVELFWRGPRGEALRAIVRPLVLEKSGTEVMLRAESYPEGEVFTLPVGKISLLRRLKRSIFGE